MTFNFTLDLVSLYLFIENETLQNAVSAYNQSPEPKALSANVTLIPGNYWSVSAEAFFIDGNGAQGNGFGVPRYQVGNYEIQESCQ